MNLDELFFDENEKPLEKLAANGGFTGIFRKIACIGDSLSSGEFEAMDAEGNRTYHDYFEYSWGQYIAREAGCTVYNFSRGGMTAKEYCLTFAEANNFYDPALACQAYIIALGVNDLYNMQMEFGSMADVDFKNSKNNKPTFAGYYARIIQRYKQIQPDAKFFLMTLPAGNDPQLDEAAGKHQDFLYQLCTVFENCYVLDFRKYAPVYDEKFRERFFLAGHMNPMGYMLTAKMVMSYIDYLIRHNMDDFKQVGFIGTEHQWPKGAV